MMGYTDITIRVPNEQIDNWRTALQKCQAEGISVDKNDGFFIHPIDMVDHESSEMMTCEVLKIKQSRMFDVGCVQEAIGVAKDVIDLGKTAIQAFGKSTGALVNHIV